MLGEYFPQDLKKLTCRQRKLVTERKTQLFCKKRTYLTLNKQQNEKYNTLACLSTYMHIYIHQYTDIHACLYIYIHIYMHTYTNACLPTHMYTNIHTYSLMHIYLHANIYTCIKHICIYSFILYVILFVKMFCIDTKKKHFKEQYYVKYYSRSCVKVQKQGMV